MRRCAIRHRRPSEQATAIAKDVAAFTRDGSTLQFGLGKVPDGLMRLVSDRRRLKLFSGMLSDGARHLAERGCLDSAFRHTVCVYLGTKEFSAWLADRDDFAVAGCDNTHSIARLLSLPRFVAVNSAVSLDLFGKPISR
jgi:acyl-CoA hydrolase